MLRAVIASTEATTAKLMELSGLTRSGVLGHLRIPARDGLVKGRRTTHPRGSGPITYWHAVSEEIEDLMSNLSAFR